MTISPDALGWTIDAVLGAMVLACIVAIIRVQARVSVLEMAEKVRRFREGSGPW